MYPRACLQGNGPGGVLSRTDRARTRGRLMEVMGREDSTTYGTAEVFDLIGGSSGGSSTKDGSGAGGGAIHLRAAGQFAN